MPNTISEKLSNSYFENMRYQTPTQSFITHSTRSDANWNGAANCRRYHGITKRLTDLEREIRIKTIRKAYGKAHLMAVKAPKVTIAPQRPVNNAAFLDSRKDSISGLNDSMAVFERFRETSTKTRRNSSVRLSAPNRESAASASVKLPILKRRKSLIMNSSLSLHDLAPPPRVNQLHVIASLSPEAQYSMLRSYEQLIREELLMLKIYTDSTNDPTEADLSHINRIPSYLITPMRPNDCSVAEFFRESNEGEVNEARKIKVAHFMEIAVKILNLIETSRRLEARKNNPSYIRCVCE